MRRKPSGLRVRQFFWVACLLAPPVARVWLEVTEDARRPGAPGPSTDESWTASADVVARLREAERDLASLDVTLRSDEYQPVLARVLFEDPSPGRHALLVGVRSRKPVPPDITATTIDHRLLGRVLDVVDPPLDAGGFAVAQVQTIRDLGFRVRFVVGDRHGLAAGTGETTEDGHPLLRMVFLEGTGEPEDGEIVRTDASDGRLAPGIPIGAIMTATKRNRLPVIRSEVVGRQGQVVLLRDAMRLSAARVEWRNP